MSASASSQRSVQQSALKLAAVLLHYPGPSFRATLRAVERELNASGAEDWHRPLRSFCAEVRALDPVEWEQRYVEAFDFSKDCALYLTFHEEGETIGRGRAMVELKRTIEEAGFHCPPDELPDYIPLLLEFVSEVPDPNLSGRLTAVLQRVAAALEKTGPLYLPVLRTALAALEAAPDSQAFAGGVI